MYVGVGSNSIAALYTYAGGRGPARANPASAPRPAPAHARPSHSAHGPNVLGVANRPRDGPRAGLSAGDVGEIPPLWRCRSSQSDELTMNGGQGRTPSDRIVDGVTGPQIALKCNLLFLGVWRLEGWPRHTGRWQTGRSVDGTTASVRSVPRNAPRSNPLVWAVRTPLYALGPYSRILTFSTAAFCYNQLSSSSVVPEVPWDALEELKITCRAHLPATLSETNQNVLIEVLKFSPKTIDPLYATDGRG